MRALLPSLLFACVACDSFAGSESPPETRAPDTDCASCYVVNAALATQGERVFVGGYEGDTNRGVLRSFAGGAWKRIELGASVPAIRQLSAAEDAVYLGTDERVQRLRLESGELEALDTPGTLAWTGPAGELVVFDEGIVWTEQESRPTDLGRPAAVSGMVRDDLYVLDDSGEIAHASADGFTHLEAAPMRVQSIAADGGGLLAVAGEDHGGGKTGPGAIMRFADGQWSTLTEAPNDALLGVASHGEVIYAVGGSRRGDQAVPIAWHFDGAHWRRHELRGTDAFFWAVACTERGVCYAAGTDNTFLDLSIFD